MKRRAMLLLGSLLVASTSGCLSPTLPLPPPEEPDAISESGTADGFWEVRGTCTPGARVLVKNLATGVIAGTDDKDHDGHYFIRIEAEICDAAELYEVVGNSTSDGTFFVIQPQVNGQPDDSCQ